MSGRQWNRRVSAGPCTAITDVVRVCVTDGPAKAEPGARDQFRVRRGAADRVSVRMRIHSPIWYWALCCQALW
jgi:hypothetical protein